MSALGQKRTFAVQKGMSALPPKADMCSALAHVRFVPIADIDHVSHSDPRAKKETACWRSLRNLVKRFAQAAAALASAFRKASRSALIVAASVVGMPCGKPL